MTSVPRAARSYSSSQATGGPPVARSVQRRREGLRKMLRDVFINCISSIRPLRSLRLCGSTLFVCVGAPLTFADAPAKKITYQDDLLPVLRDSCLNCHN